MLLDDHFDPAITLLFETTARYAAIGARRDALQTGVIANMLSAFAGQHERGEAGLRACCAEAAAMGATYVADWARFEIAMSLWIRGHVEEATHEYSLCADAVAQQPLFRVGRTMVECWRALEERDGATIERLTRADFGSDTKPPVQGCARSICRLRAARTRPARARTRPREHGTPRAQ